MVMATDQTTTRELKRCLRRCTPRIPRPIERWIEEELVLPNGPFKNERYLHARHPVSRLWFSEIDTGRWIRFAAVGPTQNGKSLMCYVAVVLYHLFELEETVVVGLPNMNMANDKWSNDFLPVIKAAAKFRKLLPRTGEGSKGGKIKSSVTFTNDAVLKFMTAGGDDKSRAAFPTRVVAMTEVDGMDSSSETSREADKVEQIEARTRSFGLNKRIYLECTASFENGRIWQEVNNGSAARIYRQCPHCKEYVALDRQDLSGWESAETEEQAAAETRLYCSTCGEAWTEADRQANAETAVLVHRGQTVLSDGTVVGDPPNTQTCGVRWNAVDNPFATIAQLGIEEWQAKRAKDREGAEKKLCQFVWALPYKPPVVVLTDLDPEEVAKRRSGHKRGVPPVPTLGVMVAIDTGKRALRWEAHAILPDAAQPIIEYGEQTVESDRLGVTRGLLDAFRRLREYFDRGWTTTEGRRLVPLQVWIDSGWWEHQAAVYEFCAVANQGLPPGSERYRPSKGYGEGQRNAGRYVEPEKNRDPDILFVGEQFYIARVRKNGRILPGVTLVHMNADHWKSQFHQRLKMPAGDPESITLWDAADPFEHSDWTLSVLAEQQIEKQLPSGNTVVVFERKSRNNHMLDAGYAATCGGVFIHSLAGEAAPPSARPPAGQRKTLAEIAGRKR